MQISVDLNDPRPVYEQIVDSVRLAIARGALEAGDRLPAIRETAVHTRVNRNTVSRAYRELEHLGLVWARQGSGFYVSDGSARRERENRREALRAKARELVVEARLSGVDTGELVSLLQECVEALDREEPTEHLTEGDE